jgi:hypothetical protein
VLPVMGALLVAYIMSGSVSGVVEEAFASSSTSIAVIRAWQVHGLP